MCTAAVYKTKDHYFGRTLDVELSYREVVTITPRRYPFRFRRVRPLERHYALIGMSAVDNGYPLYFEATNEMGLSMAGLNFPQNAVYRPEAAGMDNVAPFEFIPWILGQCATIREAEPLLERLNLVDIPFRPDLPLAPLHWIIADRENCRTVESVADGLKLYDNPIGILTNNPPFDFQMYNLSNYINLSREEPVNRFSGALNLEPYSRGMGAIGLPGDLSSASRFVRAAFTKLNSVSDASESGSISQFFHILGSVTQQRGCAQVGPSLYEFTRYTSCCNLDRGIYYYTTYENSQITAVSMDRENLEGRELISYPLVEGQQIYLQN